MAASAATATAPQHSAECSVPSIRGFRLHAVIPWVCALAVWGAVIAAGFLALEAYANSRGARGRSLADWPRKCVIPIDGTHPTLLIFLHPLCPCSSASIDELKEIAGRCGDRVRLNAVVLCTDSLEREGEGAIERSLTNVPDIQIWPDIGGALARRFGVLTSGHVLLYGPSGHLIFSGGITSSRAHRGDNLGRSAVLSAILADPSDRGSTPVFGCPLFDFQPTAPEEARQ
jgi:hypothetical protein